MVGAPRTRGDCEDGPRPCPWRCRHRIAGSRLCVLDLVERGPLDVAEIAALLGTTEGAVRKTIAIALRKLRGAWKGR